MIFQRSNEGSHDRNPGTEGKLGSFRAAAEVLRAIRIRISEAEAQPRAQIIAIKTEDGDALSAKLSAPAGWPGGLSAALGETEQPEHMKATPRPYPGAERSRWISSRSTILRYASQPILYLRGTLPQFPSSVAKIISAILVTYQMQVRRRAFFASLAPRASARPPEPGALVAASVRVRVAEAREYGGSFFPTAIDPGATASGLLLGSRQAHPFNASDSFRRFDSGLRSKAAFRFHSRFRWVHANV